MEFETGVLLAEASRLVRANIGRVIVAAAMIVGGGVAVDLIANDPAVPNLLMNITILFLQFWLTAGLLSDLGRRGGSGGFGAVFAVGLLSGLGTLLGILLLVIPGIILAARWSMGVPFVLSEEGSAIDALRRSWEASEDRFWQIFAILAMIYVPMWLGLIASFTIVPEDMALAASLLLNGCLAVGSILGWHAAIAMFLASQPQDQGLEEIFA